MCFLSLLGHARRLLSPYLHDIYLLALSLIYLKPAYTHTHTIALTPLLMYTLVNKQSRILSLSLHTFTRTRTISHSLALTNSPNFFCAIPGRKMRSNVETCCSRRKAFEALKLWKSQIAQARTKNLESMKK